MKISHHAKQRASERLDVNRKFERDKLFKRALRYGHPISEFAGDFENYLSGKKRARNTGVKVYDGNVYIYRNQTVITVFPVPEKYLPIDEHYASYIKNNPLLMKLYDVVDKKDVVLELVTKDANGKVTAFGGDNTWRILDEGDYTIYELSVPTGYKKWDSANFTISADQEGTTAKYLQPTAFLGSYAGSATAPDTSSGTGATSSSGFGSIKEQNAGGTVTFRYDTTTGTLSQDLYNEYLDQLPATGGMGTVLFTAGGIAVILMAGALFVVYMKKRNAEEEE